MILNDKVIDYDEARKFVSEYVDSLEDSITFSAIRRKLSFYGIIRLNIEHHFCSSFQSDHEIQYTLACSITPLKKFFRPYYGG